MTSSYTIVLTPRSSIKQVIVALLASLVIALVFRNEWIVIIIIASLGLLFFNKPNMETQWKIKEDGLIVSDSKNEERHISWHSIERFKYIEGNRGNRRHGQATLIFTLNNNNVIKCNFYDDVKDAPAFVDQLLLSLNTYNNTFVME
jgi:hypothetical protein